MSEPSQTNPNTRPGAFSIPEFAEAYKIGRSTVYQLLDCGAIKSFHVGRRRLISYAAAEKWQRDLEAKSTPTTAKASGTTGP